MSAPVERRSRLHVRAAGLIIVAALLGAACTSATLDEEVSFPDTAPSRATAEDTLLRVASTEQLPRVEATPEAQPALPALPVPQPLPLDPYAPTPEVVLGRVLIPAIGVDEPLQQGMTLSAINRGPSQWPGTALPGQVGNMVLAGHRTTYSRPFHDLDLIQPGDEMIVETPDATHRYVATGTEIVSDDALWIADQTYGFTATTFACHPKGSARQRIVVSWQLVDDAGDPVPALA